MKVFVVDNVHMIKDKDGRFYSPTIYDYAFLQRYLKAFDEVKFIGKVKHEDVVGPNNKMLSGPNVEIVELPWYQGLGQMIRKFRKLRKIYREQSKDCDCYVFRVAQMESFFMYLFRKNKSAPYVLEVVNDPATFVDMPKPLKWFSVFMLRRMAKGAIGASYVTEKYLQSKYPLGKKKRFESYYSSINLDVNQIASSPIQYAGNGVFKIVHVSNAINTDIKGHYTLLKMTKDLLERGIKVEVLCVGDGTKVDEYREFVAQNGLTEVVRFIGRISSKDELLSILRNSNLMVLPTKMEGLPRTIIEAMAVGLPCLSTPVAGIPELLDEKYLFDPQDYRGFASKVEHLMNAPDELLKMSVENIEKAKAFTSDVLETRRTSFYKCLRESVNI